MNNLQGQYKVCFNTTSIYSIHIVHVLYVIINQYIQWLCHKVLYLCTILIYLIPVCTFSATLYFHSIDVWKLQMHFQLTTFIWKLKLPDINIKLKVVHFQWSLFYCRSDLTTKKKRLIPTIRNMHNIWHLVKTDKSDKCRFYFRWWNTKSSFSSNKFFSGWGMLGIFGNIQYTDIDKMVYGYKWMCDFA